MVNRIRDFLRMPGRSKKDHVKAGKALTQRMPVTSYGNFEWACGHTGPAVCAQCWDSLLAEKKLVTTQFGDTSRNRPTQMLVDSLAKIESAEVAVLVWRDADGDIQTKWSSGYLTERLGILQMAGLRMIAAAEDTD